MRMTKAEYEAHLTRQGSTETPSITENRKKRFVIGIDPGVSTGIAVYCRRDKCLIKCETSDFWRVYENVHRLSDPTDCVLYIEDASLIKYTFHSGKVDSTNYNNATSRRVGGVQRECTLLIEGFERAGYDVVRVKPSGQKWNAATFQAITKWQGRTSEHARDAARLVWRM